MTWAMGVFGKVFFRKAAMGFGDVKLMAMIGALLGWKAAVLVFFVAPVFGSIFGLISLLISGSHYVRYGPFLALAAVLVIFYEPLAAEYLMNVFRESWSGQHFLPRVPFVGPSDAGIFP
jgi:prepilin signal peptidase PulO-like enzyme (type II secretory pathway)